MPGKNILTDNSLVFSVCLTKFLRECSDFPLVQTFVNSPIGHAAFQKA